MVEKILHIFFCIWEKWDEPHEGTRSIGFSNKEYIISIQTRKCKICNKYQIRSIDN